MPEKTIRERIQEYQSRLSDMSSVDMMTARKILVELTSYWGNVNQELVRAMSDYNRVKMEYLKEIKSVARAVVAAETSMEWQWWQEVKGYSELIKEMTRSLKYFLRASEDEYRGQ
jgi:hypothetical protein